jgi:site-specific recombinase XerD
MKKLKANLDFKLSEATTIVGGLKDFSFLDFEHQFLQKKVKVEADVFSAMDSYIESLKKQGRANTASSYGCALNSLERFCKVQRKKKLGFEEVSPEFLKTYEQWMMEQGRSLTTVGIYLRSLRTIINQGIEEGLLSRDKYPFIKRRYQIPAGQNIKKALTKEDVSKIINYEPKNDAEHKARDLWVFSYLCQGINVKDIAKLRYRNIDGNSIIFIRSKTEQSSRSNRKPIVTALHPLAKEIIQRWGQKQVSEDTRVFDLVEDGLENEKELAQSKQATKTINKYIARVAEAVGIEQKVTTYTARHSFATVLKRGGAPIEFISESLGHSDLRTTESYLANFDDDMRTKYSSMLTDFD